MLLRCITGPVSAVTSSAKLLHRHRREPAVCPAMVQIRAGDAFSLCQTDVRSRYQRDCFGSLLLASLTALLCEDQAEALSQSVSCCRKREQTNGQVSCRNYTAGTFLLPHCRLLNIKWLLAVWASGVLCCLTARCVETSNLKSFRVYAITNREYCWHPAQ